jgi:hypothetical protein
MMPPRERTRRARIETPAEGRAMCLLAPARSAETVPIFAQWNAAASSDFLFVPCCIIAINYGICS